MKIQGSIRLVEHVNYSLNGNPRKMIIIDDGESLTIAYTKPNSSYGYTVSNYKKDQQVVCDLSMYRGKLCINSIEEV